jgi:hypothetical protein
VIVAPLRLANGGDGLALRRDGEVVARVRYGDAPEGDVYRDDEWHALGATDRKVVVTDGGTARAFVLPDSPGIPVETRYSPDDSPVTPMAFPIRSERTETVSSRSERSVKAMAETGKSSGSYRFSTVIPSRDATTGSSDATSAIRVGVGSGP